MGPSVPETGTVSETGKMCNFSETVSVEETGEVHCHTVSSPELQKQSCSITETLEDYWHQGNFAGV